MKAIPKRLLPSKVSYKEYTPDTGEGATYKDIVYLENVKIEEKKLFSMTKDGNEIVGSAMLFYDLINSKGLSGKPTNQSEVIYEDRTYHIVDTDILRANSDIAHHYEILLK